MKKLLAALGFAALLGSPAMAFGESGMNLQDFLRNYTDATPETFDMIDTDNTGVVTEQQLEAAVERGLIDEVAPMPPSDDG